MLKDIRHRYHLPVYPDSDGLLGLDQPVGSSIILTVSNLYPMSCARNRNSSAGSSQRYGYGREVEDIRSKVLAGS